ncbi:phosphatase PAP2 family protein [Flavihumibacter petaseus]|uniref:Putative phosphatase n=1 Tax=Flavihumibacter petaseus NBRC 106054 TaxID=1220578 RepID=A0A0E9N1Q3_9BACT|nr:phosphatase PAP2 family protein [Flavihumibacter petaseus]GAO43561.1 putative phosphatase [Flavihumibacter petaseus NBRC 106054]
MDLIDRIISIDKNLAVTINRDWSNPVLDTIFQHIRETYFWLPMYLFFLVLAPLNFGKRGWIWIVGAIVCLSLTDQVSSNLIKNNIMRLRPCRDPEIADQIRIFIRYCPGSSSFTSSHATNHFGFATFTYLTIGQWLKPWSKILFVLAGLVSFAQVYVGVHYPIDITAGALLGIGLGYGMSIIFNKNFGPLQ